MNLWRGYCPLNLRSQGKRLRLRDGRTAEVIISCPELRFTLKSSDRRILTQNVTCHGLSRPHELVTRSSLNEAQPYKGKVQVHYSSTMGVSPSHLRGNVWLNLLTSWYRQYILGRA